MRQRPLVALATARPISRALLHVHHISWGVSPTPPCADAAPAPDDRSARLASPSEYSMTTMLYMVVALRCWASGRVRTRCISNRQRGVSFPPAPTSSSYRRLPQVFLIKREADPGMVVRVLRPHACPGITVAKADEGASLVSSGSGEARQAAPVPQQIAGSDEKEVALCSHRGPGLVSTILDFEGAALAPAPAGGARTEPVPPQGAVALKAAPRVDRIEVRDRDEELAVLHIAPDCKRSIAASTSSYSPPASKSIGRRPSRLRLRPCSQISAPSAV